jgi:hypothetical protein
VRRRVVFAVNERYAGGLRPDWWRENGKWGNDTMIQNNRTQSEKIEFRFHAPDANAVAEKIRRRLEGGAEAYSGTPRIPLRRRWQMVHRSRRGRNWAQSLRRVQLRAGRLNQRYRIRERGSLQVLLGGRATAKKN